MATTTTLANPTRANPTLRASRIKAVIFFISVLAVGLVAMAIIMSRDNSSSSLTAPDAPSSVSEPTDSTPPTDTNVPADKK